MNFTQNFPNDPITYPVYGALSAAPQISYATEAHLILWTHQFTIVTKSSFQPFKSQKFPSGRMGCVPTSEKTVEFIKSLTCFLPVSAEILSNSNFKVAEHIKAMQEIIMPTWHVVTHLHSFYLHDPNYNAQIKPLVDNIVVSLKSYSTSDIQRNDADSRKQLRDLQVKKLSSTFKKMYKEELRFKLILVNLDHLIYSNEYLAQEEVEQEICKQVEYLIQELVCENREDVLQIFYRIQRNLQSTYTTQVFVCVKVESELRTSCLTAPYKSKALNLSIACNLSLQPFFMDIHGLAGLDEKSCKLLLQQQLSNYQHLYYRSKHISPEFIFVQ